METVAGFIDERWAAIVPVLSDYIRIPNKSPAFDPDWEAHGHMDRAVALIHDWARARAIDGMRVEVQRLEGRTPVIVVEVPSTAGDGPTVMLYGHLDKQPETSAWRDGLAPWEPVLDGDHLYGRGSSDDGYAAFAVLTAIEAVREGGGRHHRCVALIEASEESGSPDLPTHLDALGDRLGPVDLVIGLDSGCSTYDRLWVTTSLRGLVGLDLRVDVLTESIHSEASGVVPSSMRILRTLLSRLEDENTGRVLLDGLHVDIPAERVEQAKVAAAVIGPGAARDFPFAGGTQPMVDDPAESILARTWRPALSVTALEGAPKLVDGANVVRPFTAARLSMRLPPRCDADAAMASMVETLTANPPYSADVSVSRMEGAQGWDAPSTAAWLATAINDASVASYGQPPGALGIGGTIPFMAMLGERFPDAQFLVTGVLGPGSNAHGPNEFLHLPTARRVTACVAHVLDAHAAR